MTTKRRRGSITAVELEAELAANPEYQARVAKNRAEQAERIAIRDRALAPVLEALHAAGCPVSHPHDVLKLAETNKPLYIRVLPILLDHLQRPYPHDARDLIADVFHTKAANVVWDKIVALFRQERDEHVRDTLANVIIINATRERLGEIIDLVRDPKNGPSRVLLLVVLTRTRDPRGLETMQEMANDPDLVKEITYRLGLRKKRKK